MSPDSKFGMNFKEMGSVWLNYMLDFNEFREYFR